MDILVDIAQNYVHCSVITSHKPAAGYKLLEFDECYAICRSVEVVNSRGLKIGAVQSD